MTSDSVLQTFKEDFQFSLDKRTVNLYHLAIKQLLDYTKKPFDEIITRDIRNWLNELQEKGYKATTIKAKLTGIKQFYKYCMEEERMSENPGSSIPFPKVEDQLPRYLLYDQMHQLRKLVGGNKEHRALIEVLYATGMRISELAAMKIEDIEWDERMIEIPKGKRKKGRIVLFTRGCAEYLKDYLENRSEELEHSYVFLNTSRKGPICVRTVELKFEEYSKQLQVKVTPHTLRHTFAAHLAQKGMPLECIQALLGHDSPHQTHLYARLYDQARKEMYDEFV